MSHRSGLATGGSVGGPFTVAQWQELEHQAFIFKYLKAGLPVPPHLIAPIRRSFESMPARFFHHPIPTLSYSSLYGKKYDPEPGRCRRTDGKKWRCSKDAYPGSKYCERHMSRSRNRSRKLVELKTTSQSLSTVASVAATASSNGSASSQSLPFHSYGKHDDLYRRSNTSQFQLESIPYGVSSKEYRGHHEHKPEAEKRNCMPEVSGSMNSSVDTEWCLPTAQLASYPEPRNGTLLQFDHPQIQALQDIEPGRAVNAAMSKQEHYFFDMDFNSQLPTKQDQSLHPRFDEWPKSRHHGSSYMGDQNPEKKSHSNTQLSMSMSIPKESSFSKWHPDSMPHAVSQMADWSTIETLQPENICNDSL